MLIIELGQPYNNKDDGKYHKCSGMRMEKVFLYIGNNHVGKEKKHRNDSLGEDKQ